MAEVPEFRENVSRNRGPHVEREAGTGKRIMPLRVRLVALVVMVLLPSLACGGIVIAWHAGKSVQTELRAAIDVGVQTILNGFDDHADPYRLIATFNGNRHVRAVLLDADNHPLATSTLYASAEPVPGWFRGLIGGKPGELRLAVPSDDTTIVLQADPINEVGEVWGESRDTLLMLAGFAVLSALAISVAVGRALRPIEQLSAGFGRIGDGDYRGGLPECGPPELARLASGFNRMAERLATIAAQNQRLNERLLTLQAEERADLARDLHDEIGPLLFAVDMTAATIGRGGDIPTHVRSIHEAVSHMQRHVRTLLERLRPLDTIGLDAAIQRLVAFWRSRRCDIGFVVTVRVDGDRIDEPMKEAIYRVVQEAVSNAIRHGEPTRLEICIEQDDAEGIRVTVSDNGAGMPLEAIAERGPGRLGLIGMRERVMALAGTLTIQPGQNGKGLTLVACLPWVARDRDTWE